MHLELCLGELTQCGWNGVDNGGIMDEVWGEKEEGNYVGVAQWMCQNIVAAWSFEAPPTS